MPALAVFLIILALSLPFGLLAYLVPSSIVRGAGRLWTGHHRLAELGPLIGLTLAIGVYVLVFSTLSLLRHSALGTHAFDLGVYDQVIWNSSQGRLFELSLSDTPVVVDTLNYLGYHFSPGLVLLVPIYWIVADVRALLFLQTVAIASAAVPIYLAAVETLKNRAASLGLAVVYLLSPATGYINLFDFHSIAVAMPLIAFAVYFMRTKRYMLWGVMLGMALSFKEDVAVLAVAMGLYIALKQRRWVLGSGAAVVGVLWLYLAVEEVIPRFGAGSYQYLSQYAYLGGSLGEIALTVLLNPLQVVSMVADPARLEYALHLIVPLGLTPLFGPSALLVTLPVFGYVVAGSEPLRYSIIFHYSAPIMASIFPAAADGIRRLGLFLSKLTRDNGRHRRSILLSIMCFVLATAVLSYYLHGRGPLSIGYNPSSYKPFSSSSSVFKAISLIPADASVSAHRDIVPQLTHRRYIFLFPEVHDADFLLLWEGNESNQSSTVPEPEWKVKTMEVLSDPRYELLLREEGFIMMRKRAWRNQ